MNVKTVIEHLQNSFSLKCEGNAFSEELSFRQGDR